jgi:hypothetical protein
MTKKKMRIKIGAERIIKRFAFLPVRVKIVTKENETQHHFIWLSFYKVRQIFSESYTKYMHRKTFWKDIKIFVDKV